MKRRSRGRSGATRRSLCVPPESWCSPGSAAVTSGFAPSATAALFRNGKSGLRQDEKPLEDGGAPRLATLSFGSPDQPAVQAKLHIPGCKIEKEIGRGGFGAVYRARRADGSVVAVKVMLSRVDADDAVIEKF